MWSCVGGSQRGSSVKARSLNSTRAAGCSPTPGRKIYPQDGPALCLYDPRSRAWWVQGQTAVPLGPALLPCRAGGCLLAGWHLIVECVCCRRCSTDAAIITAGNQLQMSESACPLPCCVPQAPARTCCFGTRCHCPQFEECRQCRFPVLHAQSTAVEGCACISTLVRAGLGWACGPSVVF